MWRMLQQDEPDDYVMATGENHTIREFAELAFQELDIAIDWQGKGLDEKGFGTNTGKQIIGIDKKYYRPTEVNQLLGDATKAKKELGWEPKTSFKELVKIMVQSDWGKVKRRGY